MFLKGESITRKKSFLPRVAVRNIIKEVALL